MVDLVGLAVHEPLGPFDDRAADEADALMAQADAQHRKLGAEMADDVVADAAFARRAGAGGNDDVRRGKASISSSVTLSLRKTRISRSGSTSPSFCTRL